MSGAPGLGKRAAARLHSRHPVPEPMTTTPDFRQHLEVETPEHIVLDYEIAGLGSRALAALIDSLLMFIWGVVVLVLYSVVAASLGTWAFALLVVALSFSVWGYFTFFEGLRNGQTPGKRQLGIRVIQDSGHSITVGAAAVRNLLRIADFLPPPYLIGAIAVAIHPKGKRLGDLVAGTVVVRDQPTEVTLEVPATDLTAEPEGGMPELTDEEFRMVREYAERAPSLPDAVRTRVAERLTERLAPRFPTRPEQPERFLAALYQEERARRRGRFGSRGVGPDARRAPGAGVAERMAARQAPRWEQFHRQAERAARDGLDSFAAAELPDFAARYREVAADLARARTYRAAPAIQQRLERLVAAGHNVLYRDERHTGATITRFLLQECPAAVVAARRTVLLAFLAFAVPAAAGFLLIHERPALAEEVLPETMLERAEAGAERSREGRGYYEADAETRPLMASMIMTNNIQVAFYCFVGGIFLGVGSLVLLAMNGLSIGATSSHFANVGLLGYLWTFIIGHGVLELFAIWVAGAAGFMLGRALIAPGELSRSEALVITGRQAVRMIGAVVLFLMIAGLIEGFISASTQPLAYRLALSSASLVFLVLYLWNGARSLRATLPLR